MARKRTTPPSTRSRPSGRARAAKPAKTPDPLPPLVYAQASPHSVGGVSMFEAAPWSLRTTVSKPSPPTSEVIRAAAARLQDAGFQILQISATTINIAGPRRAPTRPAFGTHAGHRGAGRHQAGRQRGHGHVHRVAGHRPAGPDRRRAAARSATCSRASRSRSPCTAMQNAFPPPKSYWHLDVPGRRLARPQRRPRAPRRAHRAQGIKVVMGDSGWFRHPFFVAARLPLVAGRARPGRGEPDRDESGHGTGESANVFAVAPGRRLHDGQDQLRQQRSARSTPRSGSAPHIISQLVGLEHADRAAQGGRPGAGGRDRDRRRERHHRRLLAPATGTGASRASTRTSSPPAACSWTPTARCGPRTTPAASRATSIAGRNVPTCPAWSACCPGASYIMLPVAAGRRHRQPDLAAAARIPARRRDRHQRRLGRVQRHVGGGAADRRRVRADRQACAAAHARRRSRTSSSAPRAT